MSSWPITDAAYEPVQASPAHRGPARGLPSSTEAAFAEALAALVPAAWASLVLLLACSHAPRLTPSRQAGCEADGAAETRGGPLMTPGRDCMSCHHFRVAGTVFPTPTSQCNGTGVADVKVEVADGDGVVRMTMITNSAGNFFTRQDIPMPYTVRITAPDGTMRAMRMPQTDGNCVHCHRMPGTAGALGRVFVGPEDLVDTGVASQGPSSDAQPMPTRNNEP